MQSPIIWIAGGVDKGNDYSMLTELVQNRVKALVCIGTDNKKLIKAFKEIVPVIVETSSADEAVQTAYRLGKRGILYCYRLAAHLSICLKITKIVVVNLKLLYVRYSF